MKKIQPKQAREQAVDMTHSLFIHSRLIYLLHI